MNSTTALSPGPTLGLLGLALYYSAELWLRRGGGRSIRLGKFDRKTTPLATAANIGCVVLPWIWVANTGLPAKTAVSLPILAAAVVMSAAIGLRFVAMYLLGARFSRTLDLQPDHTLLEAGPYRVVRHPGYLAALLFLSAHADLVTGQALPPLLVLLAMLATYAVRIPAEEAMLRSQFGEEYRSYQARTWRLFPGVY